MKLHLHTMVAEGTAEEVALFAQLVQAHQEAQVKRATPVMDDCNRTEDFNEGDGVVITMGVVGQRRTLSNSDGRCYVRQVRTDLGNDPYTIQVYASNGKSDWFRPEQLIIF